jgi:hypothetical protein
MNVKIVRLVTGDEVLCEIVDCGIEAIHDTTIRNPTLIGVGPDGTLATAPLSVFAKTDQVTISNAHILFTAEPEEEILDAYKSKYGGIITPKGILS